MSMIVVVTRNVSPRMRGFLASTMLELAPGVYVGANISAGVRERIWETVSQWFPHEHEASVVMVYPDAAAPGHLAARFLGVPPLAIELIDGLVVTRKQLREEGLER